MVEQNVFSDFIEDPVEAQMLHIKSYLSALVVDLVAQKKWTQAEAAKEFGISQPRISEIKQAKLEKFSVDFLLILLVKLGYQLDIAFTPKSKKKPMQVTLKRMK